LRSSTSLQITGVDISREALDLARVNKHKQSALYPHSRIGNVCFLQADILSTTSLSPIPPLIKVLRGKDQLQWDILVSNPPYISPKQFNKTTARSVRNFEPKVALVPDAAGRRLSDEEQGDLFYPRLLDIARELDVKVLLMEVGDLEQAKRVATRAKAQGLWAGIEIWCDEPGTSSSIDGNTVHDVPVRGRGKGRSVVCWRKVARPWLE
jgi:methylase of polypeptide subunit release factors